MHHPGDSQRRDLENIQHRDCAKVWQELREQAGAGTRTSDAEMLWGLQGSLEHSEEQELWLS